MKDPRQLIDQELGRFDPGAIEDFYDADEPLELESVAVTPADSMLLARVPISVENCTLVGCDLSVFTFVNVRHTIFDRCKLRGATFSNSILNALWRDCLLAECALRMITLKAASFERSTLTDCDFYGSRLESVQFPNSTITGVGFDDCEIQSLDLTQSSDLAIGDPRTLRGATIAEKHVPLIALRLAQLSGIEVDETSKIEDSHW